jgi:hypothetical protein
LPASASFACSALWAATTTASYGAVVSACVTSPGAGRWSSRRSSRRLTRLTNGFSKKVENHAHSVAIHTMHYNFVRIHQALRCTPAMAAGVTATLWEFLDMVKVLEDWEAQGR